MRIEKITLRNYRQFRDTQITFPKRPDTDLHFIIGTNGTGKTNVLNAINWCLYGEEAHLSKDSQKLPLMNLRTISKTQVGKESEVYVKVWTETEQGSPITFLRRSRFRKHSDDSLASQGTTFEVTYVDEHGNTRIVSDEEARVWVERFAPERIREFFFFDGERLDRYFREATGQNIRHAVFQISQIDLLETQIDRKLETVLGSLRKEAGKSNPKIESARIALENAQSAQTDTEERIAECEKQIGVAKEKIASCRERLVGVPDIERLETERSLLQKEAEEINAFLQERIERKKNTLLDYGSILLIWDAVTQTTETIDEKRRLQQIPPPVDRGLLEDTLHKRTCAVCGTPLNPNSQHWVEQLLKEVSYSSETAMRLVQIEGSLYQFREKRDKFHVVLRDIDQEIERYEQRRSKIVQRQHEIDNQVMGYDENRVRQWYSERSKFEEILESNQQQLGALQMMRQQGQDKVGEAQSELERELRKEERVGELTKKVAFCERALHVVRSTQKDIMNATRERIERETRRQFFNLVWKKETFSDVRIAEDFGIGLIHSLGYECLGSISAGERELLALSFTLALHQASGFDSPILIDTPVARISDVNRENFAKVLGEVSTSKQIVLLFTPDEYSREISDFLHGRASGRYRLELTQDEIEAKVEEL